MEMFGEPFLHVLRSLRSRRLLAPEIAIVTTSTQVAIHRPLTDPPSGAEHKRNAQVFAIYEVILLTRRDVGAEFGVRSVRESSDGDGGGDATKRRCRIVDFVGGVASGAAVCRG